MKKVSITIIIINVTIIPEVEDELSTTVHTNKHTISITP